MGRIYKGGADPQKVRIQVKAAGANYLRSLPLHPSQREIEQTDEFSVFEFFIAPTFDFIQELRTHGSNLKSWNRNGSRWSLGSWGGIIH